MIRKMPLLLSPLIFLSTALVLASADGAWLAKVPSRDHERTNPYQEQPDAIAAGRRIFLDHCSKCHGENAEGTKNGPR